MLLFRSSAVSIHRLMLPLPSQGRYKDDVKTNGRTTHVVRDGTLLPVRWQDVVVGDIVKVREETDWTRPVNVLMCC